MSSGWRAYLVGTDAREVPLFVQDVDLNHSDALILGTSPSPSHVRSYLGEHYHLEGWAHKHLGCDGSVARRAPVMHLAKDDPKIFAVVLRGPAVRDGAPELELGHVRVVHVHEAHDGWVNLLSDGKTALMMSLRARGAAVSDAFDVYDARIEVVVPRLGHRVEHRLRVLALRLQHALVAAIGANPDDDDDDDDECDEPVPPPSDRRSGTGRVLDTWWREMGRGVRRSNCKTKRALERALIGEHTNNDDTPLAGTAESFADPDVLRALSQTYAANTGASLFTTHLGATLLTQAVSPAATLKMAPVETATAWIQAALSEQPEEWRSSDDAFHQRMVAATTNTFMDRLRRNVGGAMSRATELLLPKPATTTALWLMVKRGVPGAVQGAFKSETAAAVATELASGDPSMRGMAEAVLRAMGRDAQKRASGDTTGALAKLAEVGADKLPVLEAKATVLLDEAKPLLKSMARQFSRVELADVDKWADRVVKMIPDAEKLDGMYSLFSRLAKATPGALKKAGELAAAVAK